MAEDGKVIAVTGSSRGIGAEIARELGRRGFTVGCLSRGGGLPEDPPEEATLLPFQCDVTDEKSVNEALGGLVKATGRLNGLVNNAGLLVEHKSAELSVADYDHVMRTNATSVMMVSREAYPHLCVAGGGGIVNIGSFWDKIGVPRNLSYCASKAAIAAITRCHAVEWARNGMEAAFLVDCGENTVWPKVPEAIAGIQSGDESRRAVAVRESLDKLNSWK